MGETRKNAMHKKIWHRIEIPEIGANNISKNVTSRGKMSALPTKNRQISGKGKKKSGEKRENRKKGKSGCFFLFSPLLTERAGYATEYKLRIG